MPLETSPLPRHLSSLQYARGIAALCVVYFHACLQLIHVANLDIFPKVGASGVDVFFVLSGLVMWLTTADKESDPLDFVKKRIIRIVPLYWLVTVAAAISALLIPQMLRSTAFDVSHFFASLFFVPWWNPAAPPYSHELFHPLIVPGWTLNMELMFYFLFSMCLILSVRFRPTALAVMIAIMFVIGSVADSRANPLSFYGDPKVFEFLAGVILANYILPFLRFNAAIAMLTMVGAFAALLAIEFAISSRSILLGIPAFLIVASCVNLERVSSVPRWTWLEALGDASYSIYLTHVFVIAGLRIALQLIGLPFSGWIAVMFMPLSIILSALVGIAVHVGVERPSIRAVNRLLRARRPAPDQVALP